MIAALEVDGSRETPNPAADYRCPQCGALLFRATIALSGGDRVETWCKRCKTAVVFVAATGDAA